MIYTGCVGRDFIVCFVILDGIYVGMYTLHLIVYDYANRRKIYIYIYIWENCTRCLQLAQVWNVTIYEAFYVSYKIL